MVGQKFTELLNGPFCSRMSGHVDMQNPAGTNLHGQEVEDTESRGGGNAEITCDNRFRMVMNNMPNADHLAGLGLKGLKGTVRIDTHVNPENTPTKRCKISSLQTRGTYSCVPFAKFVVSRHGHEATFIAFSADSGLYGQTGRFFDP
jgi:hypothetical protein